MKTGEQIRKEWRDAGQEYERELEKNIEIYHSRLKSIQSECPHDYSFHSDPSGNNDSFWECDYCKHIRTRLA